MVYEPSMGSAVYVLLNPHGPNDFRFQIGTKFVLMEAYSLCQSSYLLLNYRKP